MSPHKEYKLTQELMCKVSQALAPVGEANLKKGAAKLHIHTSPGDTNPVTACVTGADMVQHTVIGLTIGAMASSSLHAPRCLLTVDGKTIFDVTADRDLITREQDLREITERALAICQMEDLDLQFADRPDTRWALRAIIDGATEELRDRAANLRVQKSELELRISEGHRAVAIAIGPRPPLPPRLPLSLRGLENRYVVLHRDGSPIDLNDEYFVLRVDGACRDELHRKASLQGLHAYAQAIMEQRPKIAGEILARWPVKAPE